MQGLDVLAVAAPRRARLLPLVGATLLLLTIGGSALLYRRSLFVPETIPGIQLADTRLGAVPSARLEREVQRVADRYLLGTVQLDFGTSSVTATLHELGVRLDLRETRETLARIGKTGSFIADLLDRTRARRGKLRLPLELELDRDVALDYFMQLKEEVDRPVVAAKLDLEHQHVVSGREGYLLHVYDSLVATELALRRGEQRAALAVEVLDPELSSSVRGLKDLRIDHVLGQFATVYSLADKDRDRAHNLKVAAARLDGKILQPGEQLSFNATVGKRTEAEGYRTAPVITEGELVDGMAGGACQLSSTLFAAAFFAGLDLVSSRPHTRPSSYIKMGLDAAVAYPGTDLVIKNPYPFPVVVHYKVNEGKVRVRLLGKQRPWRKVVFEREIVRSEPFKEVVRQDPSIPRGRRVVMQVGTPGVKLLRRRLLFSKGREPEKTEEREIRYPPNTQYISEGAGPPNPRWEQPKEPTPFSMASEPFRMEQ